MAASVVPSTWFGAGYTASSGGHTITLNTNDAASNKLLTKLTDVNADPTTGNAEVIGMAILEMLLAAYNTRKAADAPTNFKVIKSVNKDPSTGNDVLTYSVTVQATPPSTVTVATET